MTVDDTELIAGLIGIVFFIVPAIPAYFVWRKRAAAGIRIMANWYTVFLIAEYLLLVLAGMLLRKILGDENDVATFFFVLAYIYYFFIIWPVMAVICWNVINYLASLIRKRYSGKQ